jgi:hypothetical protein
VRRALRGSALTVLRDGQNAARCALEDVPGGAQLAWKVTIEREGSEKPACVAETVSRRYEE